MPGQTCSVANDEGVEGGDDEEGHDEAREDTADDRAAERPVGLAAAAQCCDIWISAKNAARAVITIGRARIDAALRIAGPGVKLSWTFGFWAKSIRSTVFDTTMPTMKMTPAAIGR
jgi:hypothetical protein